LVILLLVVLGAALLTAQLERQQTIDTALNHIQDELNLLGVALRKPILKQDYAFVEEVIMQWGKSHENGSIVALSVTLPDGKTLVEYSRPEQQRDTARYSRLDVNQGSEKLMTVETIRDFSDEEDRVAATTWRFTIAGLAVVLLLWVLIQLLAHVTLRGYKARIRQLEDALAKSEKQAERSNPMERTGGNTGGFRSQPALR
jgi:hypothetical protein